MISKNPMSIMIPRALLSSGFELENLRIRAQTSSKYVPSDWDVGALRDFGVSVSFRERCC